MGNMKNWAGGFLRACAPGVICRETEVGKGPPRGVNPPNPYVEAPNLLAAPFEDMALKEVTTLK